MTQCVYIYIERESSISSKQITLVRWRGITSEVFASRSQIQLCSQRDTYIIKKQNHSEDFCPNNIQEKDCLLFLFVFFCSTKSVYELTHILNKHLDLPSFFFLKTTSIYFSQFIKCTHLEFRGVNKISYLLHQLRINHIII